MKTPNSKNKNAYLGWTIVHWGWRHSLCSAVAHRRISQSLDDHTRASQRCSTRYHRSNRANIPLNLEQQDRFFTTTARRWVVASPPSSEMLNGASAPRLGHNVRAPWWGKLVSCGGRCGCTYDQCSYNLLSWDWWRCWWRVHEVLGSFDCSFFRLCTFKGEQPKSSTRNHLKTVVRTKLGLCSTIPPALCIIFWWLVVGPTEQTSALCVPVPKSTRSGMQQSQVC